MDQGALTNDQGLYPKLARLPLTPNCNAGVFQFPNDSSVDMAESLNKSGDPYGQLDPEALSAYIKYTRKNPVVIFKSGSDA